jgi:surfactin synthase thioesterase subunit
MPGPWLRTFRPSPAPRLRLLCIPYAGGNAFVYRGWPALLPAGIEVAAVQPPGRDVRFSEPACDQLPPYVQALAEALDALPPLPLAIFGHSLGALLAFELTRRLRALGRPPPLQLFLSGLQAPDLPPLEEPVHALPEEELIARLRRLNGTPEEVLQSRPLLDLVLPAIRADFKLLETYRFREEPPLALPAMVLGGLGDASTPAPRLKAWERHLAAFGGVRMFPGDHFFLMPQAEGVTRLVAKALAPHL